MTKQMTSKLIEVLTDDFENFTLVFEHKTIKFHLTESMINSILSYHYDLYDYFSKIA